MQAENLVKRLGGSISKTVGKKVDYVVVGLDAGACAR